jgi:hypothetical protein
VKAWAEKQREAEKLEMARLGEMMAAAAAEQQRKLVEMTRLRREACNALQALSGRQSALSIR